MRNQAFVLFAMAFALSLPFALARCDRQVSSTSSETTKSDGTVKTQEKTVTVSPGGTVTKEETKKTETPTPP